MWDYRREAEWVHCKWTGNQLSCQEWTIETGRKDYLLNLSNSSIGGTSGYLEKLVSKGFTIVNEGNYPLGKIDFNVLKDNIKRDISISYTTFLSTVTDTSLCGFALVSDSCAMTLGCLANTERAIKTRENHFSKEEAEVMICEWPLEDRDTSLFTFMDIINCKNEQKVPFDPQIPFKKFRRKFYNSCICALEELRQESFFPNQEKHDFFILFFNSFDDISKDMPKRLNPKRLAKRIHRVAGETIFQRYENGFSKLQNIFKNRF